MANRRSFITGILAAGLFPKPTWANVGSPAFLSAGLRPDGTYVLCGLRTDGQITFARPLPARGHAAAAHPTRAEAVAFARRPGRFAIVLDCTTGQEKARLNAPSGRHFYGHGTFSADGTTLFTTENDFNAARGVIGIWDARNGYTRIGEFASGGTGPHDIKLLPGTDTLVIANGGIETHPDTGRTKLNIPTMQPTLSVLDFDGKPLEHVTLDHELRKNSIRHLAVASDGTVAFAMQWQGDLTDRVPLLGTFAPCTGNLPRLAEAQAFDRTQNYLGSVAINKDRIAVTAPRGGVFLEFATTTLTVQNRAQIDDVCGVAPAGSGFVSTSGQGLVTGANTTRHTILWDNHLIVI